MSLANWYAPSRTQMLMREWDRKHPDEYFEPVEDGLGHNPMQNLLEIWFLRCSAQQRGQQLNEARGGSTGVHAVRESDPKPLREGEL